MLSLCLRTTQLVVTTPSVRELVWDGRDVSIAGVVEQHDEEAQQTHDGTASPEQGQQEGLVEEAGGQDRMSLLVGSATAPSQVDDGEAQERDEHSHDDTCQ